MDYLSFKNRETFHQWLEQNAETAGTWLLFGKPGGPQTLSANDALEEALCFGWIDGQMKKRDEHTYLKYFAPRRPASNWSEKNKKLAQTLIDQGLMTERGFAIIERSKTNGSWDKPKPPSQDTPEHIALLTSLLTGHEPASTNFAAKSLSVKKTYARMYFDAKSEAAKQRRLGKIIDRLNQNLNPM